MTKRQLIDRITTINISAEPSFLAAFGEEDLQAYLDHLDLLAQPRLTGNTQQYEKYFTASSKTQFIYDVPESPREDRVQPAEETDFVQQETYAFELDDSQPADDIDGLLEPVDPQPACEVSDEPDAQERSLTPVMAGGKEEDASYVSDENESESWLF